MWYLQVAFIYKQRHASPGPLKGLGPGGLRDFCCNVKSRFLSHLAKRQHAKSAWQLGPIPNERTTKRPKWRVPAGHKMLLSRIHGATKNCRSIRVRTLLPVSPTGHFRKCRSECKQSSTLSNMLLNCARTGGWSTRCLLRAKAMLEYRESRDKL